MTTKYTCSQLVINTGSIVSGSLSDTEASGGGLLVLAEVMGTPGFSYDFEFEGITETTAFRVYLNAYYEGNAGHNVKLQYYSGSTWANVTSATQDFPSTTSLAEYVFAVPASAVIGGELKLRIVHTTAGAATHEMHIDYFYVESAPVTFTVDTASDADMTPTITAAALADADFIWVLPSGDYFTGKAPVYTEFDETGECSLLCEGTDWNASVTGIDFSSCPVSGDISGWELPTALTEVLVQSTSFSGDVGSGWTLPSGLVAVRVDATSVSGNIGLWSLPSTLVSLYAFDTSVSGDISGWTLPTTMDNISLTNTTVSGDICAGWTLPSGLLTLFLGSTSVSGNISSWTWPTGMTGLRLVGTSISGDITSMGTIPASLTALTLPTSGITAEGDIDASATSGLTVTGHITFESTADQDVDWGSADVTGLGVSGNKTTAGLVTYSQGDCTLDANSDFAGGFIWAATNTGDFDDGGYDVSVGGTYCWLIADSGTGTCTGSWTISSSDIRRWGFTLTSCATTLTGTSDYRIDADTHGAFTQAAGCDITFVVDTAGGYAWSNLFAFTAPGTALSLSGIFRTAAFTLVPCRGPLSISDFTIAQNDAGIIIYNAGQAIMVNAPTNFTATGVVTLAAQFSATNAITLLPGDYRNLSRVQVGSSGGTTNGKIVFAAGEFHMPILSSESNAGITATLDASTNSPTVYCYGNLSVDNVGGTANWSGVLIPAGTGDIDIDLGAATTLPTFGGATTAGTTTLVSGDFTLGQNASFYGLAADAAYADTFTGAGYDLDVLAGGLDFSAASGMTIVGAGTTVTSTGGSVKIHPSTTKTSAFAEIEMIGGTVGSPLVAEITSSVSTENNLFGPLTVPSGSYVSIEKATGAHTSHDGSFAVAGTLTADQQINFRGSGTTGSGAISSASPIVVLSASVAFADPSLLTASIIRYYSSLSTFSQGTYSSPVDIYAFSSNKTLDITASTFAAAFSVTDDASHAGDTLTLTSDSTTEFQGDITVNNANGSIFALGTVKVSSTADQDIDLTYGGSDTPFVFIHDKSAGDVDHQAGAASYTTGSRFGVYDGAGGYTPDGTTATLTLSGGDVTFADDIEWDTITVTSGTLDIGTDDVAYRELSATTTDSITENTARLIHFGNGSHQVALAASIGSGFANLVNCTGSTLTPAGDNALYVRTGALDNYGTIDASDTVEASVVVLTNGADLNNYGTLTLKSTGTIFGWLSTPSVTNTGTVTGGVITPYQNGTVSVSGDWSDTSLFKATVTDGNEYGTIAFAADSSIGIVRPYAPDAQTTTIDNSGGYTVQVYGDITADRVDPSVDKSSLTVDTGSTQYTDLDAAYPGTPGSGTAWDGYVTTYDGVLNNDAIWYDDQTRGDVIALNTVTSDGYIGLNNFNLMNGQGDYTWSIRINTTETAEQAIIHCVSDSFLRGGILWLNAGGAAVSFGRAFDGKAWTLTGGAINDGDWHTLTLLHDNTNNRVKLYCDGTDEGWQAIALTSLTCTTFPLRLGVEMTESVGTIKTTNQFKGYIDDFRIYGALVSDAVAQAIHNSPWDLYDGVTTITGGTVNFDGTFTMADTDLPLTIDVADATNGPDIAGRSEIVTVTGDITVDTAWRVQGLTVTSGDGSISGSGVIRYECDGVTADPGAITVTLIDICGLLDGAGLSGDLDLSLSQGDIENG